MAKNLKKQNMGFITAGKPRSSKKKKGNKRARTSRSGNGKRIR